MESSNEVYFATRKRSGDNEKLSTNTTKCLRRKTTGAKIIHSLRSEANELS